MEYSVVNGNATHIFGGTTYMYDGERCTIHGYKAERAETIIETLDLHRSKHTGSPHYVSKDWLGAQLRFWRIYSSDWRKDAARRDTMLAKLRYGVDDQLGLPSEMYPSEIFVDLESGLASHKAKGPAEENKASTGTKRTHDQSASGPSSVPESKRSGISVFENGGSVLGPTPSTLAASTPTRKDLNTPSLSTLSKNQTHQINAFRKKQYYFTAVGSYTVTCPMIEEQFQNMVFPHSLVS